MSKDRATVAFHEAAHCVQALVEGRRVGAVTLNGGLVGAAMCAHSDGDGSVASLKADLRIAVAGDAGEERAAKIAAVPRERTAADDTNIYFSDLELRLVDRFTEIAADNDGDPRETMSDEATADDLAATINPDDPAAEIELAREIAYRTLAIHSHLHQDLADALLQWDTLGGAEIRAIVNTQNDGGIAA